MKFLNYDRVLCLSPHPDDVEYGVLGTMMKYKDTKFDVVKLKDKMNVEKFGNILIILMDTSLKIVNLLKIKMKMNG